MMGSNRLPLQRPNEPYHSLTLNRGEAWLALPKEVHGFAQTLLGRGETLYCGTDHGLYVYDNISRDLKAAKPEVASEGRELLGNILLGAGDITRENLNLALEAQKKDPQQRLGKILIDMDFATAEAVARALALQVKVHFLRLGESNVDKDAATLINARIAKKHTCIPIRATESVVTLAMASPFDLIAIEDVERATEREVEIVVTIASDIDAAIERLLGEA